MRKWRTPEQLVEIGLSASRVLMVNEAHDGLKRCVRTRNIGTRMIEPAHAAGVRLLAMEALSPGFAVAANRDRCLGPGSDYLAESDLRELMQAALAHGWDQRAAVTTKRAEKDLAQHRWFEQLGHRLARRTGGRRAPSLMPQLPRAKWRSDRIAQ